MGKQDKYEARRKAAKLRGQRWQAFTACAIALTFQTGLTLSSYAIVTRFGFSTTTLTSSSVITALLLNSVAVYRIFRPRSQNPPRFFNEDPIAQLIANIMRVTHFGVASLSHGVLLSALAPDTFSFPIYGVT